MEQEYILKNADSFEPKHIFECGQCFRWNKNEDDSYTVHFKNGSHFSFVVVDTVVVVGEHCHVLFVDSKIRERELRSLAPVIDPCTMPEGNVMLNPKPLYLSMD